MSKTTYDQLREQLTVEWSDPALLPKRKTTYDLQVATTQEAPTEFPAQESN